MRTVVNLHSGLNKTLFVKNAHIPSIISELIADNTTEFYKDIPSNIRIVSYKELGSGSYGTAYRCSVDNHIIKITKDESEAHFYTRLSNLGIFASCVCNGVVLKEITDGKNSAHVILREYAFPITEKEESDVRRFFREYNQCIEGLFPANIISYNETPEAHQLSLTLQKNRSDLLSGKYRKGIVWAANLLKDCRDILRKSSLSTPDRKLRMFGLEILQLAENGIYFPDLKPRNIGKRENDSYCIFDIGRSFFAI